MAPPLFEVIVADREGDQLLRFDATGRFAGRLSSTGSPAAVIQGADGALLVADFQEGRITRRPADGGPAALLFHDSILLEEPVRLLLQGSTLYALGNDTMNLVAIDLDSGKSVGSFGWPHMRFPHDVALGPGDRAYVAMEPNSTGGVIQVWNTVRGELVKSFAPPQEVELASGITLGPDGLLYVSDWFGDRILRYDTGTLRLKDVFVPPGHLRNPGALQHGPDGRLYVLASGELLRFDGKSGAFVDVFVKSGSGGMVAPRGFAFATLPLQAPAPALQDLRPDPRQLPGVGQGLTRP